MCCTTCRSLPGRHTSPPAPALTPLIHTQPPGAARAAPPAPIRPAAPRPPGRLARRPHQRPGGAAVGRVEEVGQAINIIFILDCQSSTRRLANIAWPQRPGRGGCGPRGGDKPEGSRGQMPRTYNISFYSAAGCEPRDFVGRRSRANAQVLGSGHLATAACRVPRATCQDGPAVGRVRGGGTPQRTSKPCAKICLPLRPCNARGTGFCLASFHAAARSATRDYRPGNPNA